MLKNNKNMNKQKERRYTAPVRRVYTIAYKQQDEKRLIKVSLPHSLNLSLMHSLSLSKYNSGMCVRDCLCIIVCSTKTREFFFFDSFGGRLRGQCEEGGGCYVFIYIFIYSQVKGQSEGENKGVSSRSVSFVCIYLIYRLDQ